MTDVWDTTDAPNPLLGPVEYNDWILETIVSKTPTLKRVSVQFLDTIRAASYAAIERVIYTTLDANHERQLAAYPKLSQLCLTFDYPIHGGEYTQADMGYWIEEVEEEAMTSKYPDHIAIDLRNRLHGTYVMHATIAKKWIAKLQQVYGLHWRVWCTDDASKGDIEWRFDGEMKQRPLKSDRASKKKERSFFWCVVTPLDFRNSKTMTGTQTIRTGQHRDGVVQEISHLDQRMAEPSVNESMSMMMNEQHLP